MSLPPRTLQDRPPDTSSRLAAAEEPGRERGGKSQFAVKSRKIGPQNAPSVLLLLFSSGPHFPTCCPLRRPVVVVVDAV